MKLFYVNNYYIKAEIKNGLDHVCKSVVPSQYRDQCLNLIETYTDTIIFLIAKEVPTEYLCEIIGVCQHKNVNQLIDAEKYLNDVIIHPYYFSLINKKE